MLLAGCSNGVVVPDPELHSGLVRDCQILLSIRDDLAGTAFLNWSYRISIAEWDGITVEGSPSRVTKLVYGFQNLNGVIPPGLGRLDALKILNFTDNELNGAIPPELGNLANLEFLDIGVNRLIGSIPEELGNLAKLEFFDVGQNLLTGAIPPQLGYLLRLKTFIVGANSLTGTIPTTLGQLTFLHEIAIDRNMLSGCVPAALLRVEISRIGNLNYCDN